MSYGQKWNFRNIRLICILLKMLKGARVASSAPFRDINTAKKLTRDSQNKAYPRKNRVSLPD